ncbi:hypothetical protein AN641_04735 [Candidatus Epulonipiscioides gigas]|nr:hypothetical protein AN641_04735 [Epulopiscium sp. SCG-C07WGA-EpuloA2]
MFKGNLFRVMIIFAVFTFGYIFATTFLGYNPANGLIDFNTIAYSETAQLTTKFLMHFSIVFVLLLSFRKLSH